MQSIKMKVKPVLKNRFWVIENEDGSRVGTLSWNDEKYVFSNSQETVFFNNKKQISSKLGELTWIKNSVNNKKNLEVNGYPTSVYPYNSMFDIKRKLPLFTKSKKSKSIYCAGYFIIKFNKGWVKSFCPKLITIDRYESRGPFRTVEKMKEELNLVI